MYLEQRGLLALGLVGAGPMPCVPGRSAQGFGVFREERFETLCTLPDGTECVFAEKGGGGGEKARPSAVLSRRLYGVPPFFLVPSVLPSVFPPMLLFSFPDVASFFPDVACSSEREEECRD